MNDIDTMPTKCNNCPYWELAEKPYICDDCEDKLLFEKHEVSMHKVLIYKDDVIRLIEAVIKKKQKTINDEEVVSVNDLNKLIEELEHFQK